MNPNGVKLIAISRELHLITYRQIGLISYSMLNLVVTEVQISYSILASVLHNFPRLSNGLFQHLYLRLYVGKLKRNLLLYMSA